MTIKFILTAFSFKVIGTLGRIPNGRLVPLSKPERFLVSGKSAGQPSAFQAIEDRILTDAPSSMIVPAITILYIWTMILYGILAWNWGLPSWFQSKDITRLLGGGTEYTAGYDPDDAPSCDKGVGTLP